MTKKNKKWEYNATQTEVNKMNAMGEQGWEAFAITHGGWTYFKREKVSNGD